MVGDLGSKGRLPGWNGGEWAGERHLLLASALTLSLPMSERILV